MRNEILAGAIALAALCIADTARTQDTSKYDPSRYPDWSGERRWTATGGGNRYDQTKPPGRAQRAPLTAEYQAVFEAGFADRAAGGQGNNRTYACIPGGLPRDMAGNQGIEFVVTPKVTHVLFLNAMPRRIYTDGRDWPDNVDPAFAGYSIGKWIDEDGDGRFDVLEVETRNFNGPRSFDNAGIPLHEDNQTIIKERIYQDRQRPELLHDDMTTIDHALTEPWTVRKTYRLQQKPNWVETICSVGNMHVQIGNEAYFLSADGLLMPSKRGQRPPDLRYFNRTRN
jgi:hypothetical protein